MFGLLIGDLLSKTLGLFSLLALGTILVILVLLVFFLLLALLILLFLKEFSLEKLALILSLLVLLFLSQLVLTFFGLACILSRKEGFLLSQTPRSVLVFFALALSFLLFVFLARELRLLGLAILLLFLLLFALTQNLSGLQLQLLALGLFLLKAESLNHLLFLQGLGFLLLLQLQFALCAFFTLLAGQALLLDALRAGLGHFLLLLRGLLHHLAQGFFLFFLFLDHLQVGVFV